MSNHKNNKAVEEDTRLTAYVPPQDYRKLRISLIKHGMSVSEWARQMIHRWFQEHDE